MKLSPWQLAAANLRLEILNRAEEIERGAKNGQLKHQLQAFCNKVGITYRTYRNWKVAYDNGGGLDGLAPRYRGKDIVDEIRTFIEAEYCQPEQPSIRQVHEKTNAFCRRKDLRELSYYEVRRVIQALPESVRTKQRQGREAHANQFGYYIKRDWNKMEVNECWCGDHRQFDVFVYRNGRTDKCFAPWISAWMDMRSRAITGYLLHWNPNSDTIALSLRDGILKCGKPVGVYLDNGKDYTSNYISGRKSSRFRVDFSAEQKLSLFGKLNISTTNALPYNHKAKPIESLFKFMALRFDRKCPGWRGPDTAHKPEKLEHEIKNKLLWTFEQFECELAEWIAWYNERVHSETGKAPVSFYAQARVIEVSERELDFVLLKEKEGVKIKRRGIQLMGLDFVSEELFKKKLTSETVTIRWNPQDLSQVLVFDEGGFVCTVPQRGAANARGMSEREWQEEKRIQKAQREKLREATAYMRKKAKPRPLTKTEMQPVAQPKPMFNNSLKLITREGILARQVENNLENQQQDDERRTGTDDLPIFGIEAPPLKNKKMAKLFFEDFLKDRK